MSPEISERVKEVKNIASELQDSSFEDCLKSLQKWVRFAVNQHIEIYCDFAKKKKKKNQKKKQKKKNPKCD